eukprot:ANDGO_00111.mRNA.1 Crystal protein
MRVGYPVRLAVCRCIIVLLLLVVMAARFGAGDLIVETTTGVFQGGLEPDVDTVATFRGIPFAKPPVGSLRWKSPQPFVSDDPTVQQATQFKGPCSQYSTETSSLIGQEDCLYLNIWAPISVVPNTSAASAATAAANDNRGNEKLVPVMFWITGGGFVRADPTSPDYSGKNFVAERGSVIFVSFNYRVAAYGFLTLPELSAESRSGSSGMYGFEDQRAALQWVRANIRQFGGDPNRITMIGQSAGAISTCAHIASPLSTGLFHSAILMSGGCDVIQETQAQRFETGFLFAQYANCAATDLSCLRSLSVSDIFTVSAKMNASIIFSPTQFGPGIDGVNLMDYNSLSLGQRIAQGSFKPVPVLIGSTKDEMSLFVATNPVLLGINEQTYPFYVAKFTNNIPELVDMYVPYTKVASNPRDALVIMSSESVFICSSRRFARSVAALNIPVYSYQWSHAPQNGSLTAETWTGAYHFSDVPFVFGTVPDSGGVVYSLSPAELLLSRRMRLYWLNFVESQGASPNAAFDPLKEETLADSLNQQPWPLYRLSTDEYMVFDTPAYIFNVTAGLHLPRCDTWDRVLLGSSSYSFLNPLTPGVQTTTGSNSNDASDSNQVRASLALAIISIILSFGLLVAWIVFTLRNSLKSRRHGSISEAYLSAPLRQRV